MPFQDLPSFEYVFFISRQEFASKMASRDMSVFFLFFFFLGGGGVRRGIEVNIHIDVIFTRKNIE